MKRVMFFGILCLLISCLSVHHSVCYAQVKASIWIDSTNKNADTLDYDILLFKDSPKILNFYIENLGKGDIWIETDQAPNFVLESDKANPEQFREFYPDNIIFPFTITENSKPKAFPIRFKPVIDTSGDDRLGIKTAKIQFTLSNIDTTDTTSYTRYFYVRGWKTKDFLAKRDTLINFDSVLIGQYNPPTQWTLRNVSKTNITVSKTSIDTDIDSSAISISQDPKKLVNPNELYSVDIGYHEYVLQAKEWIDKEFPNRHMLIIGDSTTVLPQILTQFPMYKPDMIFVDGNHDGDYPKKDIYNSIALSHPDTFIIIDDVVPWMKDILSAIDEFTQSSMIQVIDHKESDIWGWSVCKVII